MERDANRGSEEIVVRLIESLAIQRNLLDKRVWLGNKFKEHYITSQNGEILQDLREYLSIVKQDERISDDNEWAHALSELGVDPDVISKAWDIVDKNRQDIRDKARDNHERSDSDSADPF